MTGLSDDDLRLKQQQFKLRNSRPPAPVAVDAPTDWGAVGQDVLESTGRGLTKGLGYAAGGMADIANIIRAAPDKAWQYLLTGALQKTGVMTKDQADRLYQNMPGEAVFSSGDQINNVTESALTGGKGFEKPKTGYGEFAETVSSMLPAAATAAGSVAKVPQALVRYGVLPGAASEAAGQVTKGTPLEGPARLIGGLAGTGVGASMPRSRGTVIGNATESVTPAQWAEAQRLMEWSHQPGNSPLTAPEALQQATNSNTGLANLMRVVEQSEGGGGRLRDLFSKRPDANQTMANRELPAALGPLPVHPSEVPGRVQKAAEDSVRDVETQRTRAVSPDYRAAATDTVPAGHVESLLVKIDSLIAKDKSGLYEKHLGPLRDMLTETPAVPPDPAIPGSGSARVPVTDIENLDRIYKHWRDKGDLPAIAAEAIPKEMAAVQGRILSVLRGRMLQSSARLKSGSDKYQSISENIVDPTIRSPLGQLAQTGDLNVPAQFEAQTRIIMQPKPLPNSAGEIRKAVAEVARKDANAARQLIHMKVRQTFDESTQNLQSGEAQWGGAKFATVLAANPQQRANLKAAIEALPGGAASWKGFEKMLEVLEAQGKRQPMGSATEFNRALNQDLQGGGVGEIGALIASPGNWLTMASDIYKRYRHFFNTEYYARLFTSPDGVQQLQRLAGMKDGSRQLHAAVTAMMLAEMTQSKTGNEKPAP